MATIADTRKAQQAALDNLDNFEANNKLDPKALAVWALARRRMVNAIACLADIETLMKE